MLVKQWADYLEEALKDEDEILDRLVRLPAEDLIDALLQHVEYDKQAEWWEEHAPDLWYLLAEELAEEHAEADEEAARRRRRWL